MMRTSAQSHLGRQRAECHQEPQSVTPEGPLLWKEDMQLCMQIAARSYRLPSSTGAKKHWCLIKMKGSTTLCKHDSDSLCRVPVTCALGTWR